MMPSLGTALIRFFMEYAQIGASSCLGSVVEFDTSIQGSDNRNSSSNSNSDNTKNCNKNPNPIPCNTGKNNKINIVIQNNDDENNNIVTTSHHYYFFFATKSSSNSTVTSTATNTTAPTSVSTPTKKTTTTMVVPGPTQRRSSLKTTSLSHRRRIHSRRHRYARPYHEDDENCNYKTKFEKRNCSRPPPNQLVETVSPFDEVCTFSTPSSSSSPPPPPSYGHARRRTSMKCEDEQRDQQEPPVSYRITSFHGDELRFEPQPKTYPHNYSKKHKKDTLKKITKTVAPSLFEIPMEVWIPAADFDATSEISLDDDCCMVGRTTRCCEDRTLTPHPSFDEDYQAPTAEDFGHLYQASLRLEERDTTTSFGSPNWPSDEESPIVGGLLGACNGFQFCTDDSVYERAITNRRKDDFVGSTQDVMKIMEDDQVKPYKKYPVMNKSNYRMV